MYKAREKSLKLPIVVYDIINTYLYSIVYTYIECVCSCVCGIFCQIIVSFCHSATFRSENFHTTSFCSPKLKKRYLFILEKVSIPSPQPKDSLQIFCFTIDQKNTIKRILAFWTVSFYLPVVSTSKLSFNILTS